MRTISPKLLVIGAGAAGLITATQSALAAQGIEVNPYLAALLWVGAFGCAVGVIHELFIATVYRWSGYAVAAILVVSVAIWAERTTAANQEQQQQGSPAFVPVVTMTPPPPPTAEEIADAIAKKQLKPAPKEPVVAPRPHLTDRYMESWFPGKHGSLLIYEGSHLPTTVGKHQMFTPGVHAPESTALTGATFAMCVPTHFKWDPNRAWVLQEANLCAPNHVRYTTHFSVPIARGAGLNPFEAFWFWPTEDGEVLVKYWITSVELAPFESFFFVNVAKP